MPAKERPSTIAFPAWQQRAQCLQHHCPIPTSRNKFHQQSTFTTLLPSACMALIRARANQETRSSTKPAQKSCQDSAALALHPATDPAHWDFLLLSRRGKKTRVNQLYPGTLHVPSSLSVRHEGFAAPVSSKNTLRKQKAENSPKDMQNSQWAGVAMLSHSRPSGITFSSKTQHKK